MDAHLSAYCTATPKPRQDALLRPLRRRHVIRPPLVPRLVLQVLLLAQLTAQPARHPAAAQPSHLGSQPSGTASH